MLHIFACKKLKNNALKLKNKYNQIKFQIVGYNIGLPENEILLINANHPLAKVCYLHCRRNNIKMITVRTDSYIIFMIVYIYIKIFILINYSS